MLEGESIESLSRWRRVGQVSYRYDAIQKDREIEVPIINIFRVTLLEFKTVLPFQGHKISRFSHIIILVTKRDLIA